MRDQIYPTDAQLHAVCVKLAGASSVADLNNKSNYKKILSKVKEYFRKKREYMTQRLYQLAAKEFKEVCTITEFQAAKNRINSDDEYIRTLASIARIENKNEEVFLLFCRDKVLISSIKDQFSLGSSCVP